MSDTYPQWAVGVCEGLYDARSRHVVYVPDNPLSHVLRVLSQRFPDVKTTIATREEEAFGIAAGLYLGGGRPTVMLQSSGLGNSINGLTSLFVPYRIPSLIVISMRGDAGEWNPAQEPMGRAVAPILDAIGIPHESAPDAAAVRAIVRRIGDEAFASGTAGACLLPRRVTVPGSVTGVAAAGHASGR